VGIDNPHEAVLYEHRTVAPQKYRYAEPGNVNNPRQMGTLPQPEYAYFNVRLIRREGWGIDFLCSYLVLYRLHPELFASYF